MANPSLRVIAIIHTKLFLLNKYVLLTEMFWPTHHYNQNLIQTNNAERKKLFMKNA